MTPSEAWFTVDLLGVGFTDNLYLDDGDVDIDDDGNVDAEDALEAGTLYYYRVQAINTVAHPADGGWSTNDDPDADTASATTDTDVPSRVVVFSAAAGVGEKDDTIILTWTAPGSGGQDITSYEILVWDGSKWADKATTRRRGHKVHGHRPCARDQIPLYHPRAEQSGLRPVVSFHICNSYNRGP